MTTRGRDRRWDLVWILGAGALVRGILFHVLHQIPLYTDELQYQELAVNLAAGRGFMLEGTLTSWRPPFYPFVLSLLYRAAGTTDPDVARIFQAVLSLGTVVIVYLLAQRIVGRGAAPLAAAIMAFYPSLLFVNNYLLSEVVFIFLTAATAYAFVSYLARPRFWLLGLTGIALGLSVLTRDIVWPTVAIMIALALAFAPLDWRRWAWHSAGLLAILLVLTVPWIARNSRLQGTFTLIATNGGMVFLAGNYEHTPADRPWRAHALAPELKVRYLFPAELSEGVRQKLAVARALAYIKDHPWLTVRNSVIRMANVWGLEREMIGVLGKGVYGRVSALTLVGVTAAIFTAYVVVVLAGLGALCFALMRGGPALGAHLYVAALLVFVTLSHAPVSGHPRYHLPLIPLLAVYAAQAWNLRREFWAERRSWSFTAASVIAALLVLTWVREIFFVDLHRFLDMVRWS